jgi:hypothetical protein
VLSAVHTDRAVDNFVREGGRMVDLDSAAFVLAGRDSSSWEGR